MMRTRAVRALLALSAAFLLAAVPLSTTLACSCAMASVEQSVEFADLVFAGTAVSVTHPDRPAPGEVISSMDPVWYDFDAETIYKGDLNGPRVTVATAMDGASCGTTFGIDERWLVFAETQEGEVPLLTGLCSGNLPLGGDDEAEILAQLPPALGSPPASTETAPAETGFPVAALVGGVLAAAVIGISAWAFVVEPRRRVT